MIRYVLIIEDEESQYDRLERWVKSLGYDVFPGKQSIINAARDGTIDEFVIRQLKKHYKEIMLILCDIMLGDNYLGGIDVVKKIRNYKGLIPSEWTSKIPIAGVSHFPDRANILVAGADCVFKKNDIYENGSTDERVARVMVKSRIESFEAYLSNINLESKKVFIVHGHDHALRGEVENFLEDLELAPIILSKQVNLGNTLIEKLEQNSDVHYAIILYTPCDEGRQIGEDNFNHRARQNVVFEHGYMIGKLGRRKVCMLYKNGVELPGDIKGIVWADDNSWKLELARELKAQGFEIDLNKLIR